MKALICAIIIWATFLLGHAIRDAARRRKPWICEKCDKRFKSPQVQFGWCGSQIVDTLDWWCPGCGHTEMRFDGTDKERNEWWWQAEDRAEGKNS